MTGLLRKWRAGDSAALPALVEQLYPELKRIARLHVRRERGAVLLHPTVLVHDAYVRLVDQGAVDWVGRRHFLSVASRTMRRLLVEQARARHADKRRGIHVSLHEEQAVVPGVDVDVLDLVEALEKMERSYPFECQVVELRYLGGMTLEETAEELGVSHATVGRAWSFARTWLFRELGTSKRS